MTKNQNCDIINIGTGKMPETPCASGEGEIPSLNILDFMAAHGKPLVMRPNQIEIPTYDIPTTYAGAQEFNSIYHALLRRQWNPIIRTKGGAISKQLQRFPAMDITTTNAKLDITLLGPFHMLRITFSTFFCWEDWKNNSVVGGGAAFRYFDEYFRTNYNINLNSYRISNGAEVKKTIPSYLIAAEDGVIGQTLENCHHIDFHSSFGGGWANAFPEFAEGLHAEYNRRKTVDKITSKRIKSRFCSIIGYFQSLDRCNAAWAHISKAAIEDNNQRVLSVADALKTSGRKVLIYNTDGIWYNGEIFHGAGEGNSLGQWENDHTNCIFRAKSAGSYEYIENGKYKPVVRGLTKLDHIKSRDDWQWGDIFRKDAEPLTFNFVPGLGITNERYIPYGS